jgi:hypothetical protein
MAAIVPDVLGGGGPSASAGIGPRLPRIAGFGETAIGDDEAWRRRRARAARATA